VRIPVACIADAVECPLCYPPFHEPVTTPACGHSFDKACLLRALDNKPECPLCRASLADLVESHRYPVDLALQRIVRLAMPAESAQRAELARLENEEAERTVGVFVCGLCLPFQDSPVHVFEPRYRLLMRRALQSKQRSFGMTAHLPNGEWLPVGTTVYIRKMQMLPDGRSFVDCVGENRRWRRVSSSMRDGYHVAKVEWIVDEDAHFFFSVAAEVDDADADEAEAAGAAAEPGGEDDMPPLAPAPAPEPTAEELLHSCRRLLAHTQSLLLAISNIMTPAEMNTAIVVLAGECGALGAGPAEPAQAPPARGWRRVLPMLADDAERYSALRAVVISRAMWTRLRGFFREVAGVAASPAVTAQRWAEEEDAAAAAAAAAGAGAGAAPPPPPLTPAAAAARARRGHCLRIGAAALRRSDLITRLAARAPRGCGSAARDEWLWRVAAALPSGRGDQRLAFELLSTTRVALRAGLLLRMLTSLPQGARGVVLEAGRQAAAAAAGPLADDMDAAGCSVQ